MEKNNEKDLRVYIQPETEIVKLTNEGVICGSGSGEDGESGGGM